MTIEEKEIEFKAVYSAFSFKVQRLCLGYIGNEEEANDLLQETFIKVWQNLDTFRGESQMSTWVYRIAVNTCLQYIKKKKKKNETPLTEKAQVIKEEVHNKEEEVQLLYKCISQLVAADRLIITLLLEEVPYAEIATVTAISEGNLRVKIHRIKQQLSELYTKYEAI